MNRGSPVPDGGGGGGVGPLLRGHDLQGVRSGEIPGRRMGGKKARYIIPRASFLRYLEGDGPEPARKGGGGW